MKKRIIMNSEVLKKLVTQLQHHLEVVEHQPLSLFVDEEEGEVELTIVSVEGGMKFNFEIEKVY